jgi:hypothetical protein
MPLTMITSLVLWLPRHSWIVLSEPFLIAETEKSWVVTCLGNMADATKPLFGKVLSNHQWHCMHVQISVKNNVSTSNWYSCFCWYFLNTISSVNFHNIVHTLYIFCHSSELMTACRAHHHWHLNGHHENAYAIGKPASSSLPPYHMLLQVFIMSLKEICAAKHIYFCTLFCTWHFQTWRIDNPYKQTANKDNIA